MGKNLPEDAQPQATEQTTNADNFSYVTVRVGQLPGRITEIVLNGGRKVSDALQAAGIDGRGREVRVNSVLWNPETNADLSEADLVLVVGKIKGN